MSSSDLDPHVVQRFMSFALTVAALPLPHEGQIVHVVDTDQFWRFTEGIWQPMREAQRG